MLTTAYAAFEALAIDLWEAALNRHDDIAASYVTVQGQKKQYASYLGEYGLDLKGHVGSIFAKEISKNFDDVKAAYEAVFGKAEVAPIFDAAGKVKLASKSVIYSLIGAGSWISKFLKNTKHSAAFANLQVGDYLNLTGPEVRDYSQACMDCAVKLFKFVDGWSAQRSKA